MQRDLTRGSISRNLFRFAVPYLISSFLQTFYGLADLFITGQFNGAASISGVSIGSQLMHMLTVVIVGLAMGSTVTISRFLGARDQAAVRRSIGNTVTLFVIFAALLTLVLNLLVNPIITALSTPVEAISETRAYMVICFAGIPFITAYNVIASIFRGLGDTTTPMIFVAIAGVVNIGLDYLMIGPMGMGAGGAALATVASQSVSVVLALVALVRMGRKGTRDGKSVSGENRTGRDGHASEYGGSPLGRSGRASECDDSPLERSGRASERGDSPLGRSGHSSQHRIRQPENGDNPVANQGALLEEPETAGQQLGLSWSDLKPDATLMKSIAGTGIPIACQDGFIQISFLVITAIANSRGVETAAAVGIVEKIISFLFLVPSSMLGTLSAFAAQNAGAGRHDRSRQALRLCLLFCCTYGAAVFILCQFISGGIVSLFIHDDPEAVRLGGQYLRSYSADVFLAGIHFCFSGYFSAYGKAIYSFIHNMISVLCVRIPGAWLATKLFPDTLYPMGWAPPLGSLASVLICIGFYRHLRKKQLFVGRQGPNC